MTKEEICMATGISMEELESQTATVRLSGIGVDSLPRGLGWHILQLDDCPNLTSLPDDLTCTVLNITDCPGLDSLPDNLQVESLVIDNCPKLTCLPLVKGLCELEIKHSSNLIHLPDGLHLDTLYIEDSNIEALPENCSCLRSLSLRNCPYLVKIPDSCIAFSENLILYNCTSLSALPNIKVIFGNLNVVGTQIQSLPKGIKIGGCLMACNSKLETLPEGIRIGEYIDLGDCRNLRSLPDGLMVNGCLNLAGSSIKQLPNRLIVGGNLNILSTDIEALPSDLKVKGTVYGSKRLLDTYEINKNVPPDLPYYIWKDTSYIYYDCMLYRVISHEEFSWRTLDAESTVRIMLDIDFCCESDIDDGVSYIVMDINHNYGDGATFSEAFRRMEERIRNNISALMPDFK